MLRMPPLAAGLALLAVLAPTAFADDAKTADWPQYLGPNRDNHSPETGLLKEWPKDGPALVWKATGLGDSKANAFGSVAVVGDKIFTMGDGKGESVLYALSRDKGDKVWSAKVGDLKNVDHAGARSTPTVDGDRVYALSQFGDLVCFNVKDGSEVWRKNLEKDFKGSVGGWKYSESPLIDGDKLLCTPGGDSAIIALNKVNGEVIWKSDLKDRADYSSMVISNAGGVKQYVQLLASGVVGVDAKDGKLLWKYGKLGGNTANCPSPIALGDQVFATAGYGKGGALLTLSAADGKVTEKEDYYKTELKNKHGGAVQVGDYIYGGVDDSGSGAMWCVEWKTGNIAKDWMKDPRAKPGKGSVALTFADGNLYCQYNNGYVALVPATPDGYQEKGSFKIPGSSDWSWSHPVVLGGRLYVRDHDTLWVYDVKAK
jgi:outer membrane protein assembly factor BamB